MNLYLVSEDQLSEAVMRQILKKFFRKQYTQIIALGNRGRGYIQSRINEFNNQNPELPFFILADLDSDTCAPDIIRNWFRRPVRTNLLFRVAVREVESWLLADTEGFAKYFNLSHDYIKKEVNNPDNLANPKEKLIAFADRCKKKDYKQDIVRKEKTSYKQGPGYNSRLTDYVNFHWNISRARKKSESLNRAINALEIF